jgi:uncharacterized membrane protein YkvA (DUF1232 family)
MEEDILLNSRFEITRKNQEGYKGQYSEIAGVLPDIFKLLIDLYRGPDLPRCSKPIVNAAIANIVSPFDGIPEGDLGLYAFFDETLTITRRLVGGYEDQILNQAGLGGVTH